MANILLTNVCNLQCPYCFANYYTHDIAEEITLKSFRMALDFIALSHNQNEKIGLIGGEPTLHSQFGEILEILIRDDRFSNVHVFTNGIYIDEYLTLLRNPKFSILINCNCEEYIGSDAYHVMCKNIDLLMSDLAFEGKVTLGINIAQKDFSYRYIIDLLKKYSMHTIRLAIASPNTKEKRDSNVFQYFKAIKPRVMTFIRELLANNIVPCYDCNKLPACFFTNQEKAEICNGIAEIQRNAEKAHISKRVLAQHDFSIHTDEARCYPAVDILQDLTAIRCFGIGECSRVNIYDFASLNELRSYYIERFDSVAYSHPSHSNCVECTLRAEKRCMGGCIAYKLKDSGSLSHKTK